jgi:diadenylate cyclase
VGALRWQALVDSLVLAVGIYLVLRWSRDTRAFRIVLAIAVVRMAVPLTRQLDLVVTSWILDVASILALIFVLIAFQSELRHVLTRLDMMAWLEPRRHSAGDQGLESICSAAFSLARARRGALVVLIGNDSVADLIEGGVPLGGAVSAEILEAIFRKVSPVHDGATVVEGDHISRVGCILPLSQRRDITRTYGTRHRAAMGLAERCDAQVIVVSEERGSVSLAHGREVEEVATPEALIGKIHALRGRRPDERRVSLWSLARADAPLKAAAFGLALLFLGLSVVVGGRSVRAIIVPVELTNVPESVSVAHLSANMVTIQVRGAAWALDSRSLSGVVARFDMRGATEGARTLEVRSKIENLPPGVAIERVSPQTVSLRLVRQ